MTITVEFFGIPRMRAGVARLDVVADSIGEALDRTADRLPQWADACLIDGQLSKTVLVNINGNSFTTDRSEPLSDGDHLLILSADVGG